MPESLEGDRQDSTVVEPHQISQLQVLLHEREWTFLPSDSCITDLNGDDNLKNISTYIKIEPLRYTIDTKTCKSYCTATVLDQPQLAVDFLTMHCTSSLCCWYSSYYTKLDSPVDSPQNVLKKRGWGKQPRSTQTL